jgi:beta-lactamase superfamily II metal-dependent hydrolase
LPTWQTDSPQKDVVEVSLFGPGRGECCLVHIGAGEWVIIDSCIDQRTGENAALTYLNQINVDPADSVRLVVGTHAHDDHIAGIADVFYACTGAYYVCSAALTSEEFLATARTRNRSASMPQGGRKSAYFESLKIVSTAIRQRRDDGLSRMKYAIQQLPLHHRLASQDTPDAAVLALSPSHEAVQRAISGFAAGVPRAGEEISTSVIDPNELSVAIWIRVGVVTLLLGADLTIGPEGCGWKAVLASHTPENPASLIKIPHHGSPNAHHDGVWENLLEPYPLGIVTPFRGGKNPRPSDEDRHRICHLTSSAYQTANAKAPPRTRAARKVNARLELAKNVREPGMVGHVRARRAQDANARWDVFTRSPASSLC